MSGRGCGLSVYLKGISQSVGGKQISVPLTSFLSDWEEREECLPDLIPHTNQLIAIENLLPQQPIHATHYSLSKTLLRRQLSVGTGIAVGQQLRYSHTDIKIPDFTEYRRPSTRDPTKRNSETIDKRRVFTYLITTGVGVTAAISAKAIVQSCVSILSPAKDCLAVGKIEVDLSTIPEGKNLTVKWRGKPVFVKRRSGEDIARERAVDLSQLRDPETDEKRSPTGEWLVVIGVCTHLGCVPIPNQGDFHGYYCPCHGSHYDASGRIRKGPAPLNLEIPAHEFSGSTLIIG